jgi:hypothetical protein
MTFSTALEVLTLQAQFLSTPTRNQSRYDPQDGLQQFMVQARLGNTTRYYLQLPAGLLPVSLSSVFAYATAITYLQTRFGYDQGVLGGLISNTDFQDTIGHPDAASLGIIGTRHYYNSLLTVSY